MKKKDKLLVEGTLIIPSTKHVAGSALNIVLRTKKNLEQHGLTICGQISCANLNNSLTKSFVFYKKHETEFDYIFEYVPYKTGNYLFDLIPPDNYNVILLVTPNLQFNFTVHKQEPSYLTTTISVLELPNAENQYIETLKLELRDTYDNLASLDKIFVVIDGNARFLRYIKVDESLFYLFVHYPKSAVNESSMLYVYSSHNYSNCIASCNLDDYVHSSGSRSPINGSNFDKSHKFKSSFSLLSSVPSFIQSINTSDDSIVNEELNFKDSLGSLIDQATFLESACKQLLLENSDHDKNFAVENDHNNNMNEIRINIDKLSRALEMKNEEIVKIGKNIAMYHNQAILGVVQQLPIDIVTHDNLSDTITSLQKERNNILNDRDKLVYRLQVHNKKLQMFEQSRKLLLSLLGNEIQSNQNKVTTVNNLLQAHMNEIMTLNNSHKHKQRLIQSNVEKGVYVKSIQDQIKNVYSIISSFNKNELGKEISSFIQATSRSGDDVTINKVRDYDSRALTNAIFAHNQHVDATKSYNIDYADIMSKKQYPSESSLCYELEVGQFWDTEENRRKIVEEDKVFNRAEVKVRSDQSGGMAICEYPNYSWKSHEVCTTGENKFFAGNELTSSSEDKLRHPHIHNDYMFETPIANAFSDFSIENHLRTVETARQLEEANAKYERAKQRALERRKKQLDEEAEARRRDQLLESFETLPNIKTKIMPPVVGQDYIRTTHIEKEK